jgi:hypothetical protein
MAVSAALMDRIIATYSSDSLAFSTACAARSAALSYSPSSKAAFAAASSWMLLV